MNFIKSELKMSRAEKKRFKRENGCSPFVFYAKFTVIFGVLIGALVSPFVMWAITEFNKI